MRWLPAALRARVDFYPPKLGCEPGRAAQSGQARRQTLSAIALAQDQFVRRGGHCGVAEADALRPGSASVGATPPVRFVRQVARNAPRGAWDSSEKRPLPNSLLSVLSAPDIAPLPA